MPYLRYGLAVTAVPVAIDIGQNFSLDLSDHITAVQHYQQSKKMDNTRVPSSPILKFTPPHPM